MARNSEINFVIFYVSGLTRRFLKVPEILFGILRFRLCFHFSWKASFGENL